MHDAASATRDSWGIPKRIALSDDRAPAGDRAGLWNVVVLDLAYLISLL
jgi:hypothetical protein